MIHWETDEDERGFQVWKRYVVFSHWGMILTGIFPRWMMLDPALSTTFYAPQS